LGADSPEGKELLIANAASQLGTLLPACRPGTCPPNVSGGVRGAGASDVHTHRILSAEPSAVRVCDREWFVQGYAIGPIGKNWMCGTHFQRIGAPSARTDCVLRHYLHLRQGSVHLSESEVSTTSVAQQALQW
jgi:hypothetical protein